VYKSAIHIIFRFLSIGFFSLVVLAVGCSSSYAQKVTPEIFIRGKGYQSMGEYRASREAAIMRKFEEAAKLQDGSGPEGSSAKEIDRMDGVIDSFVDLTLEKFSDDELRIFIMKLRMRREDLFESKDIYFDKSFFEAQKMLGNYIDTHDHDVDIDLDASKLKTIIIDQENNNKSAVNADPDELLDGDIKENLKE